QVFKSSSDIGYFPRVFSKVTSKNAPITGMIILGVAQTILSLMTISPSLNNQFNSLVNLAVVTNLIPYILSMAALIPMHRLY
ncbi:amino acid permease, partial [Escherichia coli]